MNSERDSQQWKVPFLKTRHNYCCQPYSCSALLCLIARGLWNHRILAPREPASTWPRTWPETPLKGWKKRKMKAKVMFL